MEIMQAPKISVRRPRAKNCKVNPRYFPSKLPPFRHILHNFESQNLKGSFLVQTPKVPSGIFMLYFLVLDRQKVPLSWGQRCPLGPLHFLCFSALIREFLCEKDRNHLRHVPMYLESFRAGILTSRVSQARKHPNIYNSIS